MMKTCLISGLLILFMLSATGQSSVFVLVDVSGSAPQNVVVRDNARKIVYDLCLGKYDSANDQLWEWIGAPAPELQSIISGASRKPLIDPAQDGYFMIMPFGEKDTYKNYQVGKLNQLPDDLDDFFNKHYPKVFRDRYTYQMIAFAAGASIAKGQNIDSYYMIVASDNLNDPKTDSRAPRYTREEENWMAAWGTSNVTNIKLGTLKFNGDQSNFQIVVSRVDVKNINISQTQPRPGNVAKKELKLIRPAGSKSNPEQLKNSAVSVMWKCLGCDSLTEFSARLAYQGEKKGVRTLSKRLTENRVVFNVEESGLYKVTVSSNGFGIETGYVDVDIRDSNTAGGSGSILPVLLLLLALGTLGYFLWQRNRSYQPIDNTSSPRKDKKEKPTHTPGKNPFSDGGGGESDSSSEESWF